MSFALLARGASVSEHLLASEASGAERSNIILNYWYIIYNSCHHPKPLNCHHPKLLQKYKTLNIKNKLNKTQNLHIRARKKKPFGSTRGRVGGRVRPNVVSSERALFCRPLAGKHQNFVCIKNNHKPKIKRNNTLIKNMAQISHIKKIKNNRHFLNIKIKYKIIDWVMISIFLCCVLSIYFLLIKNKQRNY